jgi:parvulin-like peptidyl-prolyl isomerase
VCLLLAGAAFGQANLQPAAIVQLNGRKPITVKQVKDAAEQMVTLQLIQLQQRQPSAAEITEAVKGLSLDQKKQILDMLIAQELILQDAEKNRISVTDNEIDQQLRDQVLQAAGRRPTDAELAQLVKEQSGMDLPAFRDSMRKQLVVQRYLQTMKKSEIEAIKPPTEKEISDFYNLHRTELVRPRTVRFSLIDIPFDANDTSSKNKAKALADKLAKEIGSSPTRFQEAFIKGQANAKEAGYRAADGGYLPLNALAQEAVGKEFLDAAFALKEGEVSKMMTASSSYQIFKITETYDQKNLGLDDIFRLGTKVTVHDYIKQGLAEERVQAAMEKITNDIVAQLRKGNTVQVMEQTLQNW